MKYKQVIAMQLGGPEVLQVVEQELRPPKGGEARIRVLASAVSRPDLTVRAGTSLYSGTFLGHKAPFVPGYAVIGAVDAIGEGVTQVSVGDRVGVLMSVGGYSEYVYWKSDRLIPIPPGVDSAEAVTLLLNYIVAYQALHRSARVQAGEKVLLVGASGGIGTALLQLGELAKLKMYAIASRSKHALLCKYGATPIDYRSQDFVEVIRQAEPGGLDAVISGMTRLDYVRGGMDLLRRGGRLVCFGEPESLPVLFHMLGILLKTNLLPTGKSFKLYGTSSYFLGNRKPFIEDWNLLFSWLADGKIKPILEQKYPILEAAQANLRLESGQVTGNVVLVAPELL